MRAIDVDKLCVDLMERWDIADKQKEELIRQVMADVVTPIVVSQPTVEPERKKGHWIKGKMWSEGIGMGETYGFYYTCSECNSSVQGGYDVCGKNFCEKCGADMREPEDIPMEYFESGGR